MDCENAVIGGKGAEALLHQGALEMERLRPIKTPYGESQAIHLVAQEGVRFIFLARHGEYSYDISAPYVNYRANIYALKELGAKQILAWSGPAAVDPELHMGEYLIPDDLIDETRGRESTFFDGRGAVLLHHSPVFCPRMSTVAGKVLRKEKTRFHRGGTYVCTQGPRRETPAEIRKYAVFGAELVGMTVVPECFLARELEMCYVPLCYVSCYAEGVATKPPDESQKKSVHQAVELLPKVLLNTFQSLEDEKLACGCQESMEEYKQAGAIGPEWHEWVAAKEKT